MTDHTWTIDGIEADHRVGTTPTLTRGGTVQFEFVFEKRVTATRSHELTASGTSYGTAGASYGNAYGGVTSRSLNTTTTTTNDYDPAYYNLREYLEFVNGDPVDVGTTDRGVPWVRERLPNRASVDSLIVPIESTDAAEDVDGVWGAIVGGEDQSETPTPMRRLSLDVFVLADVTEYDTRSALFDDLGAEVI
jgi:hypothetical protein